MRKPRKQKKPRPIIKSEIKIVVRDKTIPLRFVVFPKHLKRILGRAVYDNGPGNTPLYIEIKNNSFGKQLLATFLHEYLHLMFPKLNERKIEKMESEMISGLESIGKHLKKNKRKPFKLKFGD